MGRRENTDAANREAGAQNLALWQTVFATGSKYGQGVDMTYGGGAWTPDGGRDFGKAQEYYDAYYTAEDAKAKAASEAKAAKIKAAGVESRRLEGIGRRKTRTPSRTKNLGGAVGLGVFSGDQGKRRLLGG